MTECLGAMGLDAVPQGMKDHTEEIFEDIWPLMEKHLLGKNWEASLISADLNKLREQLLRFLTFSFHHSLLLNEPDTTNSIGVAYTDQRALATIPRDTESNDRILLAVPVAFANPSYTYIKRLWHLQKVEHHSDELYEVIAKTYIWGCDTIEEQEEYVWLKRNISVIR